MNISSSTCEQLQYLLTSTNYSPTLYKSQYTTHVACGRRKLCQIGSGTYATNPPKNSTSAQMDNQMHHVNLLT
jgi:hypothetical protein